MDKALGYMALARKAGRIELGEEPAGKAAAAQKATLVLVASDASEHTWRRAKSFVSGSDQLCIRVEFTKEQLGQAIGREALALAAFTDAALALAFVKALQQPQKYESELQLLEAKAKAAPKGKQSGAKKGRSRPAAKKEH